MKKTLLLLTYLFASITIIAQVPSYYNDVNLTLSGQNLKNELTTKVTETHTTFLTYTPGVWEALQAADLDPQNNNNILLIYGSSDTDGDTQTDRSRGVNDNGGTLGQWNREHVFPRSLGNPNLGSTGPGSDAHHIRPADISMNSSRSNREFADGSGVAGITSQGYFYPGDEWKGDVARMMMFMYLRYGDRCLPSAVGIGNAVSGDANMIDLFLEWNVEDPVSDFEDNRNDVLAGIQGNRNPFIDNPAFATTIWGGAQAEDRFGGSTGGGSPTVDALLISEYVEGSSFNKAIEIANFTGTTTSLTGYELRKQNNGAGDWTAGYALSGSLSNGSVLVIANNRAGTGVTSEADVTTNSTVLNYNGNDAVGLFLNGTLVDVVGTFNGGSANFGQNITLRRKSSVDSPNTTYTTSEWDSFALNTFSGLGSHSIDGSSGTPNNPEPLTYCDAQGNNASFEHIDFVGLGGISNATGSNDGYVNFTNQIGTIGYGSNTIVLSVGFPGQTYTEFWGVWIDYNQNGTFDANEQAVSGSTSSTSNLSYTFNVPTSALSGATRMRVAMKWNAAPTACESFDYGEVEDYTVVISSSRAAIPSSFPTKVDGELGNENKVFDLNIVNQFDTTTLQLVDNREATFAVYNMLGQQVANGDFKTVITLPELRTGIYIIQVSDGQRSIQKKFIQR